MDLKLRKALELSANNIEELVLAIDELAVRISSEKAYDAFCQYACERLQSIKDRILSLKEENQMAKARISELENNVIVGSEFKSVLNNELAREYISVCEEVVRVLNSDGAKTKDELNWIISAPEMGEYAVELKEKLSALAQADLSLKVTCLSLAKALRENIDIMKQCENRSSACAMACPVVPEDPVQGDRSIPTVRVEKSTIPSVPPVSDNATQSNENKTATPERKSLWPFTIFKKKNKNADLPPRVDSVQFSAICPETVAPGKYIPLNIFMFEDEYRKIVDEVKSQLGENTKEVKSGYVDVARNSVIKILLTSDDAIIEDGEQERIWSGRYIDFQFAFRVPREFDGDQLLVSASVYINGIISVKLKLILECNSVPNNVIEINRRDYCSAFVSYASDDRRQVAAIIQGMRKARPDLDIFFDVENLRSGDIWLDALKREIDKRDLLFLCWSLSASRSEWVDKEWRYAFENKGEDSIEPIPIDTPDVCPPPPELSKKHFNDKMLFIIKSAPKLLEDK